MLLCQGRLRLGVALGWNDVEYTSLNQDFQNRADRFEEQISVLRALWTNPLVTFEGKWHTLPDVGLNPLPVQQPIPLWFGGHADPVLRRIAKMADGWLPNYRTAEEAAEALSKLEIYLANENRSLADIGIEPRIKYGDGNPDEWRSIADGWQAAHATHMTVNPMGAGFTTPKSFIKAIEDFAKALEV